jgi:hypothetical protein
MDLKIRVTSVYKKISLEETFIYKEKNNDS